MIDTGMRNGECCGLKWENVDFESKTIKITCSLEYTSKRGVYLTTPKNGEERTIDVSDGVIDLLKKVKEFQGITVESEYVFSTMGSDEPIHPQSPRRYMNRIGKKYGIDDFHPHKLRHSFASVAITSGADISSVSAKLGHKDAGFTLRQYTHANPESIKQAGEVFRKAINK